MSSLFVHEGLIAFLSNRSVSWKVYRRSTVRMLPIVGILGALWGSSRYTEDVLLSSLLEICRLVFGTMVVLFFFARWRHRRGGLIKPLCVYEFAVNACLLAVAVSSIFKERITASATILTSLVFSSLVPLVIYYTMRADSKYWRTLGTPDELPFLNTTKSRHATMSGNKSTETMLRSIDSNSKLLQNLIDKHRTLTVDFAFVDFKDNDQPIASGATCIVYRGKYKASDVAVKVFVFHELTEV